MALSSADLLVMSELFPPAIGGSAALMGNVYSRVRSAQVGVLTSPPPDARPEPEPWRPGSIGRTAFSPGHGLMRPQSALAHWRLARQARRMTSSRSRIHCARALPEGTAAMLSGRRYVCWTHGEELPVAASSRELTWLLTRVHRRAAALLANSRNTAELLGALGNPAEKIHVVYPGVDPERFRPDADRGGLRRALARPDELLFVSVGRLQSRKGHDLALKALARGSSRLPSFRYAIVGDGPDMTRLRGLAAELGLAERVSFLGSVPAEDLPGYYAAADIFLHPNRVEGQDFEGFGIVFLEAAAAGKPIIGGRSGGVPEAVADGETGLLVGGADVDEMTAALCMLAGSVPLRRAFGEAGRRRVEARFTWTAAARRVEEIDGALAEDVRR